MRRRGWRAMVVEEVRRIERTPAGVEVLVTRLERAADQRMRRGRLVMSADRKLYRVGRHGNLIRIRQH